MGLEGLRPDEIEDLEKAVRALEQESLPSRLAAALGQPVARLITVLPRSMGAGVMAASNIALDRAMRMALRTLDGTQRDASPLVHKLMVATSGAVGGGLGLAALPVELPLTTVIMLRSIADIARAEGEDLATAAAALSCIEVFALGAGAAADDTADTGYFAIRSSLALAVTDAAHYIASAGGVGAGTGAPVAKFLAKVAAKFGFAVTNKTAAQLVPVLGAVGGAAINIAFMDHFQTLARGHFTMRRLERDHGAAWIRAAYDEMKARLEGGAAFTGKAA